MRKQILPLLAILLIAATSCQKEESVAPATDTSKATLITDQAVLNQMITYHNTPIDLKGGTKSTASTLDYVASVMSPSVNGVTVSATSVLMVGNEAYVTFHERGEGFGGAIYGVNTTNVASPTIDWALSLPMHDINACDISADGTKLYLAGGSNAKGAVLLIFNLNASGIPVLPYQELEFSDAASANGVIQGGNWIYVSAGHTNGGLFGFKKNDLTLIATDPYDGASYSTANGRAIGKKHLAFEGGDVAKLHVYEIGSVDQTDEWIFNVGSVSHQNVEPEYEYFGKGVIFIKTNDVVCYMAMGQYGMKAVNIFTGVTVYESPADMITYGNTNGVSADNDYIYLANGAQGLYLYEPGIGTALDFVGSWDGPSSTPASANFVQSNNTHIFVAFGKEGGLAILSK